MTRAETSLQRLAELGVRLLVTVVVVGLIALALFLSPYEFDFSVVWKYRGLFARGLGVTLGATVAAYLLGLVLGVLVALARLTRVPPDAFAAPFSPGRFARWALALAVRHTGDLYVEIIRGTPFIVQVAIAWWGIASQVAGIESRLAVGTVALGVFAAAYMGEIFRAGIESIDRGQFEAARSLGLSRYRTLRHVVFPQAFKRMIPPLTGELIALTKESSLLFTIGVVEMMSVANQVGADTLRTFEALIVVAILYLTLTVPLSLLARHLERRLGKGRRTGVDLL